MSVTTFPPARGQEEKDFYIGGFGGLLNVGAMPQAVGDDDVVIAQNFYGSLIGGLYVRKGSRLRGSALAGAPAHIDGLWRFEQQTINGVAQNPSVVRLMAQAGGNLYNYDTNTQVGANNVLGVSALPWQVVQCYDADYAGGASDVMVITTGVGGPYTYDGTAVAVPAAWAANCPSARWCQMVNNILFFGGIPSQPNLVVGMKLGKIETLATAGQNNFAMTTPIMGLGAVGGGATSALVVGLVRGLGVIYGTGLENFYEQDIPMQDGVAAGRTMLSVDGILYFLGRDDFYMFDAVNITPLGSKVRPYILNDALFTNAWDVPMSGARSLSWAMYYNKRIYLWYDSGNVGKPNAGLVWDMNLRGWTTHTGPTFNSAALLNASTDSSPMACVVGDASAAQAYNFDVYNGTLHNTDDNGVAINALMVTKYYKIGQPGTTKRLLRLYPELFTEPLSANVLADTDYGINSTAQIVAGLPQSAALWDTAKWDQSLWSAGFLQFINQRADFDLVFEALACGMQSNTIQAPFWVQGFSGRISQQTRT